MSVSKMVGEPETPERLGRRIAELRAKKGWTQQDLADRVAISRVALSHLEAGMSHAGERTIALLAGVFKVLPHDMVEGTDYPDAKADRLPAVVAHHTESELQLAVLEADLAWLEHVPVRLAQACLDQWQSRLGLLLDEVRDRHERELLIAGRDQVRYWLGQLRNDR